MIRIVTKHYHKSAFIYIGPWCSRISWSKSGRFSNGSRWFSGWGRWRDELDQIG